MADNKKTIFITCFFGLVARDILGTDVLRILKADKNLRIVIFAPEQKEPLLKSEFADENVLVEGVPGIPPKFWERWLYIILLNLLSSDTRRVQRLVQYKRTGKYWQYQWGNFLALLGRFRLVASCARWCFQWLVPLPRVFASYFEKYKPDLLFSTDIMVMNDIRFLLAAKRSSTRTLGMVRSWDNLTMYGILPVIPDRFIVQNEPIQDELAKYQYIHDRPVSVVGIPHYDEYVREPRKSREAFFAAMGLDPKKKTVFFTPTAIKHWGDPELNIFILKSLARMNVNVLARLPVMGDIDLMGYEPPANVVLDKPARTKESVDAQLTDEANRHLADSIYHSDVVVTGPSTIIVDAAVFNKPVIYIDFDSKPMPFWQSATRFDQYNHIKTILNSGGVRIARDLSDLEKGVKQYLENPKLDWEERQSLILQKRYRTDGKSAERLANAVFNALNQ